MSAPARPGGNEQVPFLQEDFHAFPFQSQRMLVELQTNTFRDTSAVEFWAKLSHDATENATHLPHALAYAVETIRQLEEITQCIDHRVATVCRANFVDSFFDDIEAWVDSTLLQDAHTMFATNLHGHDSSQHNVEYVITLKQHAVRAFGTLRGRELFDIVRDFPDRYQPSKSPASSSSCMAPNLTHTCYFRLTNQQAEIVSTFQRAIQSRVLQPGASTTSILGVYTRTIKVITIRDLFSHEATDEWQPQPLDVAPTGRHVDDLLSSLVGIYGNPSAFVNEYRMMLAERLLMSTDFNTDRDGDEFTLHPRLEAMVQTYKDAYAVLKNPRQLDWVSYLGVVETLELYIKGMLRQFETLSSPQIAAKLALIARSEQMHSGTCKATFGAQNSDDSVQGNSGLLAAHNNECAAKLRIFASLIGSWSHPTFMKVF
ncbi:hypothetical protein DYB30_003387 [Aphanomyces astaci]|uniref:Anaphase-promoting complex subunit 2 TPR repeats domain-containing protein n=1 Tax=Aphanomyces astaci TaxID=112090 RepID=A0A397DFT4_APHAT|nr:hypothetical protein DYB30_003387 [Aphanomyces astaci]